MECWVACSGWPEICIGLGTLLSTDADCPKAAVAQRKHNANNVIFIMILILVNPQLARLPGAIFAIVIPNRDGSCSS
jgi:hypothetical protein